MSGLGLEAQRAEVTRFVADQQGVIVSEFVEVESGKVRSRPILVQSISQCRSEHATLVIAKLDRLGRNVAFISSLMEAGIDFVAADAPYANRLMLHILSAFAEHERSIIAERTKAALAAARARGVILGANGRRLAVQNRTEAIEFADQLRTEVEIFLADGPQTLREVATALNARGITTREGAAWSPGTVVRLLNRLGLRGR